MGTSLMARGLDLGAEATALWNLSHPTEVRDVHRAFVAAGAQALQTNTFGANRLALRRFERDDVREHNLAGAALGREAAAEREDIWVIGNIGPSGQVPPPQGDADLVELEDAFAEQALALAEGGVDFLHAETLSHPKELRAVMRGCLQGAPGLPLVVSISCRRVGTQYKTTLGFAAESLIAVAVEEKAAGVGANCMLTPGDLSQLISTIVQKTDVPVFAKPTIAPDGAAPLYPEEFAEGALALFSLGAAAVGGCCGTSAADIEAAARRLRD